MNLRATKVSDAGIESLRAMTGLEELDLYRTKVSNAGLAKLTAMKNLRALDLRYSRATNAGVRELVAAVPGVKVMFQGEGERRSAPAPPAGKGRQAITAWIRSIGGTVDGNRISLKSTPVTDRDLAVLPNSCN